MVFWKLSLCLAILAVGWSSSKPLEDEVQKITEAKILNIVPNVAKLFPKEELKSLVELFNSTSKAGEEQIVNDYVDKFFAKLNTYIIMSGLDPTPLEDQGFEWQFRWLWVTYTGQMTLKEGWLQGLATLGRVKDATLKVDGTRIVLKVPCTFTHLMFSYVYRAKLMGIGPKGGVDGRITDSKFTTTFSIDPVTLQAELESYKLNKAGKMSVKLTGNILVDWLSNILISAIITFLKPILNIFISGWILNGLNVIIALYNESICVIVGTCFQY